MFRYETGFTDKIVQQVKLTIEDDGKQWLLSVSDKPPADHVEGERFTVKLTSDGVESVRSVWFTGLSVRQLYLSMRNGLVMSLVGEPNDGMNNLCVKASSMNEVITMMFNCGMIPYNETLRAPYEVNTCRVLSTAVGYTFLQLVFIENELLIQSASDTGEALSQIPLDTFLGTVVNHRHSERVSVPSLAEDGSNVFMIEDIRRLLNRARSHTKLIGITFHARIDQLNAMPPVESWRYLQMAAVDRGAEEESATNGVIGIRIPSTPDSHDLSGASVFRHSYDGLTDGWADEVSNSPLYTDESADWIELWKAAEQYNEDDCKGIYSDDGMLIMTVGDYEALIAWANGRNAVPDMEQLKYLSASGGLEPTEGKTKNKLGKDTWMRFLGYTPDTMAGRSKEEIDFICELLASADVEGIDGWLDSVPADKLITATKIVARGMWMPSDSKYHLLTSLIDISGAGVSMLFLQGMGRHFFEDRQTLLHAVHLYNAQFRLAGQIIDGTLSPETAAILTSMATWSPDFAQVFNDRWDELRESMTMDDDLGTDASDPCPPPVNANLELPHIVPRDQSSMKIVPIRPFPPVVNIHTEDIAHGMSVSIEIPTELLTPQTQGFSINLPDGRTFNIRPGGDEPTNLDPNPQLAERLLEKDLFAGASHDTDIVINAKSDPTQIEDFLSLLSSKGLSEWTLTLGASEHGWVTLQHELGYKVTVIGTDFEKQLFETIRKTAVEMKGDTHSNATPVLMYVGHLKAIGGRITMSTNGLQEHTWKNMLRMGAIPLYEGDIEILGLVSKSIDDSPAFTKSNIPHVLESDDNEGLSWGATPNPNEVYKTGVSDRRFIPPACAFDVAHREGLLPKRRWTSTSPVQDENNPADFIVSLAFWGTLNHKQKLLIGDMLTVQSGAWYNARIVSQWIRPEVLWDDWMLEQSWIK